MSRFPLVATQEGHERYLWSIAILLTSDPRTLASPSPDLRGESPASLRVLPINPERWSMSILASILTSFNSTYEAKGDGSVFLPTSSGKAHLIHQTNGKSFLHLMDPLLHFTHDFFARLSLGNRATHFRFIELRTPQRDQSRD